MKRIIGILGGMGPEATADLYMKIVKNTQAEKDQDHIRVIIDSNTNIPDRTAAILNDSENPLPYMIDSADKLKKAGCDFLIMPCNTAHYFLNDIKKQVDIPFISIVETTAKYLKGEKKVILLCTEGTRDAHIYDETLKQSGIEVIYPNQELQNEVNDIIYSGVKKGLETFDVTRFNKLLKEINENGKIKAILGCTELPLAYEKYKMEGNFIDPTLILAKEAIKEAGYKEK